MSSIDDLPTADFHDPRIALENWFETVQDLDVPTPETRTLSLTHDGDGMPTFDTDRAIEIVEDLGGEAFARTDFKSASHALHRGSHIRKPAAEEVNQTLAELLSQQVMMQMPVGEQLYLREWLSLDWYTYATETCHPEVRFFVRDGDVVCHHLRSEFRNHDHLEPKARKFFDPEEDDFSAITDRVHDYAATVAEAFATADCGYSVDFVLTTDFEWYLTDMAVDALYERDGEYQNISEHPGDCEHDLEVQI